MWMAMLVLSWAPSTSVGQAVPCKLVCVVECFFSGSPLDCYNDCVKTECGGSSSGVLSKSSNCIAACVPAKCFDPSSGSYTHTPAYTNHCFCRSPSMFVLHGHGNMDGLLFKCCFLNVLQVPIWDPVWTHAYKIARSLMARSVWDSRLSRWTNDSDKCERPFDVSTWNNNMGLMSSL